MNKHAKQFQKDQRGIVAIAVTIIILAIVTLIAVGFATISRREQRQALDKQLSADAYYAAESGVNYVADLLRNNPSAVAGDIETCSEFNTSTLVKTLGIDVEYTCILVEQGVDSVDFTLGENVSRVVPLTASASISSIQIDWEDEARRDNFACNNNHYLPQGEFTASNPYNAAGILCGNSAGGNGRGSAGGNGRGSTGDKGSFANSTAIMRTTIIPVTGSFSRNQLIASSPTYFLYPKPDLTSDTSDYGSKVASSPIVSPQDQGDFIDAKCTAGLTATRFCRARITNIGNLANTNSVYLRLRSIYRSSNVRIRVYDSAGNQMEINGAQAKIDVTARAGDVVKRIQAKIPLEADYYLPEFGLQTADSLCKRFLTWPENGGITYATINPEDLTRNEHAGSPWDIDVTNDNSTDTVNDNNTCNPTTP